MLALQILSLLSRVIACTFGIIESRHQGERKNGKIGSYVPPRSLLFRASKKERKRGIEKKKKPAYIYQIDTAAPRLPR